jgi:hypothetical protein
MVSVVPVFWLADDPVALALVLAVAEAVELLPHAVSARASMSPGRSSQRLRLLLVI